jgi:hypothetical protein
MGTLRLAVLAYLIMATIYTAGGVFIGGATVPQAVKFTAQVTLCGVTLGTVCN